MSTQRKARAQRTLWEGVVNEDVRALWERWMVEADRLLGDEELIEQVFDAQGKRHEHSATWGRAQTPAEMVLRLLLLKHVRNWSFDVLERELRMNLAHRDFARIGLGKVPDAEHQIVTHYDVFGQRPSDRELFGGAVAVHKKIFGHAPRMATADAGYYAQAQEESAQEQGVKWVAIPNRSTSSAARKQMEKSRWFKNAQRWRTGCEGRISVFKRRHGLHRCRYQGEDGMRRWVWLGIFADTVINLGNALAARP